MYLLPSVACQFFNSTAINFDPPQPPKQKRKNAKIYDKKIFKSQNRTHHRFAIPHVKIFKQGEKILKIFFSINSMTIFVGITKTDEPGCFIN